MLTNFFSILISYSPGNIASLMAIEMLQYTITIVPQNGYAITDLNVLLDTFQSGSGQICIAQVDAGHINGVIFNNTLHTVDPQIFQQLCNLILN